MTFRPSLGPADDLKCPRLTGSVYTPITMKIETVDLQSWQWKERNPSVAAVVNEVNSNIFTPRWEDAKAYPSEIHVELLKRGRIPDPFLGFNEHKVQCETVQYASRRRPLIRPT